MGLIELAGRTEGVEYGAEVEGDREISVATEVGEEADGGGGVGGGCAEVVDFFGPVGGVGDIRFGQGLWRGGREERERSKEDDGGFWRREKLHHIRCIACLVLNFWRGSRS